MNVPMKAAWTIGKLFGIPVRLHISMVVVPLLVFWRDDAVGGLDYVLSLGLVVLIFGSVLLHELGHALTARRYGVRTQDIVLTPIGGMARVIDLPSKPRHELAIALAGPLVSLALAGASFLASFALLLFPAPIAVLVAGYTFGTLAWLNAGFAAFNLIPAFPMDGGRVLRALLAERRGLFPATLIAVRVGRALAVIGGVYAVFIGYWPGLAIAVFIFLSAGAELRIVALREAQRLAAEQGQPGYGPNSGGRAWTWTWQSGQSIPSPGMDTARSGPRSPTEGTDDWAQRAPQDPRDVIVVSGGKAEVLSRKDPDERS